MHEPDFATATIPDLLSQGKAFGFMAKGLLGDLRQLHARCVIDCWPDGIDEPPDHEFLDACDEETNDYVHAITLCLWSAREALSELRIRERPN